MGPRFDATEKRLNAQVVSVLERRGRWLRFPELLEERFEQDRRSDRSLHLGSSVLIAAIIYDLFLFCDYRFVPQHFLRCLVIRLAIVTPLTLSTYFWLHFNPPKQPRESITLAVSCIVAFTTLYLWHNVSGVATAFAECALILLILFVNAMMRLSFRYALASTLLCVADGSIFLARDRWLTGPEKTTCISLVVAAVIFTLVANYWMEREERLRYLLHMQVEQRGKELSSMNQELTRLSNLDALTGLANRRYFSMSFATAWDEARLTRTPLSLLLIDIDRFKKINDDYGHLYGDETLVRLGKMLREALPREGDVVTRYGGEEFVVLLPGLTLDDAAIIAERIRKLARTVNAGGREVINSPVMTISIGVASTVPSSFHQPDELLRDADLALYRAKKNGRDQVWRATTVANGGCEFMPESEHVSTFLQLKHARA